MSLLSDKQIEQLIREAGERFTLSASDKTALREELLDVIKSGELRTQEYRPSSTRPPQVARPFVYSSIVYPSIRPSGHIFNPRRFAMPLVPVIIALFIVLGGGTAVLADTAKPGDALYGIDQWIERVEQKLTTNPEAKTRLLAKFSEERLAELNTILKTDPSQLTAKAEELWKEHQQEAINRLSASIEKLNTLEDTFREKLAAATTDAQKAAFQKIIDRLNEAEEKRTEHLTKVENKTFPGIGKLPIREKLQEWRKDHQEEWKALKEEIKREIGAGNSKPNPTTNSTTNTVTNTTTDSTTTSAAPIQVALEFLIPRDADGNINPDLTDSDKDGIPDKSDIFPNWPMHTM